MPTGIYSGGRLIGVTDPTSGGGQSRLPTTTERLVGQPVSNPSRVIESTPSVSSQPRRLSGGSSSGGVSRPSGSSNMVSSPTTNQEIVSTSNSAVGKLPLPPSASAPIFDPNMAMSRQDQASFQKAPINVASLPSKTPYRDLYRRNVNEGGYVKGSLNFFGDVFSSKIANYQERTGDYYQQEGFRNLGKQAPQLLYVTPVVGPTLMVAGGSETAYRAPTLKGKAFGVAEAGLGIFGLKTEVGAFKASREISQLEKAPTLVKGVRIEGQGKGVDILYAGKSTNKNVYISKVEAPYYELPNNKFVVEGGKSTSISFNPKNLKEVKYNIGDVSARGQAIDTSPRIVKTVNQPFVNSGIARTEIKPVSISTEATGYKGFIGSSTMDIKAQGVLKEVKNPINILSTPKAYTGNVIKSNQRVNEKFIGGGRVVPETNTIDFFGAKATKVSVPVENPYLPTKISGKANVVGEVKVYKYNPKPIEFDYGALKQSTKQVTIKQTPSYIKNVVDNSFKSMVAKPTSTARTITKLAPAGNIALQNMPSVSIKSVSQVFKPQVTGYSVLQPSKSAYEGKMMYERTEGGILPTTSFKPIELESTSTKSIQMPKITYPTNERFGEGIRQPQVQRQPQAIDQPLPQLQKEESPLRLKTPTPYPPTSFPFLPKSPPLFPIPKMKMNFDDGINSTRSFKAYRRTKYFPSYDAIVRDIRGTKPKDTFTLALGTRPVTKGFSLPFSSAGRFKFI